MKKNKGLMGLLVAASLFAMTPVEAGRKSVVPAEKQTTEETPVDTAKSTTEETLVRHRAVSEDAAPNVHECPFKREMSFVFSALKNRDLKALVGHYNAMLDAFLQDHDDAQAVNAVRRLKAMFDGALSYTGAHWKVVSAVVVASATYVMIYSCPVLGSTAITDGVVAVVPSLFTNMGTCSQWLVTDYLGGAMSSYVKSIVAFATSAKTFHTTGTLYFLHQLFLGKRS